MAGNCWVCVLTDPLMGSVVFLMRWTNCLFTEQSQFAGSRLVGRILRNRANAVHLAGKRQASFMLNLLAETAVFLVHR